MQLTLYENNIEKSVEINITETLHELHNTISKLYSTQSQEYKYICKGLEYAYGGELNTDFYHCDLFVYSNEPVYYINQDKMIKIVHVRISNDIYDYCDFDLKHYCPVYTKSIECILCLETMDCLTGLIKIEELPELNNIINIDRVRQICTRCIYANCDNVDIDGNKKK
ncbi:hypothetical protein GND98_014345 [Clostridium butyricum]|jgi:hypothetical protein|uniref:Uncharacterized protein n=1 Tax=Clostridium butyricum TaxID=1492 RepID=A0A6L9EQY0_CLOBU|nr:hypothetical protein [Clostridium butyricum]